MAPVRVRTSGSASSPRRDQRRQQKIARQTRRGKEPSPHPSSPALSGDNSGKPPRPFPYPAAGREAAQPSPPARNARPRTTPLKEIRSCSAAQQREDSIPKRSAPSPPFLLYDSFRCKNCLTLRTHRVSRQLPLRNFFQHNQLPYGKTTPGASFCHEKTATGKV